MANITSTDAWPTELPRLEVSGEAGSLSVPDPSTWVGSVRVRRAGEREWTEAPPTHGYVMGNEHARLLASLSIGDP